MPYTHAMTLLASQDVDIGSVMNNTMSIGERLTLSGQMIVLGLVTVFTVLALIWGVLVLLRIFMYDLPNKRKAKAAAIAPTAEPIVSPETEAPVDDSALIAVITAAIAASEQKPVSSLRVVSFRRSGAPRWNER